MLYPAYESGLRGRKTLAYMREYEKQQWLSTDEIAALQWTKLKRLIEHCAAEVPYYQRRWREIGVTPGDIRNLDDYAQLPLLTKQDIRDHQDALKAPAFRDGLLYKTTGGSTGEPLRFGYTRESNERRNAVMWRGYAWAGSRMGRRTLYLWGLPNSAPSRWKGFKERYFHALFGRRILNSFHMTETNLSTYADEIERYRPEIIVGYVGPLVELARWMLATGRRVPAPVSIITGAEALRDVQRQQLEQAFGCPAFNTYGCREFMLIASECERRDGLHLTADHLLTELVGTTDVNPVGEVVVTDLHNYGMPFLRYVNGDLAVRRNLPCPCGRGLPMLERVEGRKLDTIRTPAGKLLPGELFVMLFLDITGVKRYQFVQRTIDSLDLTLVRDATFDENVLARVRERVEGVIGEGVMLRIAYADDIPVLANGKRRVTVSELP